MIMLINFCFFSQCYCFYIFTKYIYFKYFALIFLYLQNILGSGLNIFLKVMTINMLILVIKYFYATCVTI